MIAAAEIQARTDAPEAGPEYIPLGGVDGQAIGSGHPEGRFVPEHEDMWLGIGLELGIQPGLVDPMRSHILIERHAEGIVEHETVGQPDFAGWSICRQMREYLPPDSSVRIMDGVLATADGINRDAGLDDRCHGVAPDGILGLDIAFFGDQVSG